MKKIMIGALVAAALIGVVALTSGTYANLTATDTAINNLSTGNVDIEIHKNGLENEEIRDGSEVTKNVEITNNSKSPALIRVAIVPRWVDENNNPWPGDTSIVKINFANLATDENNTGSNQEGKWLKDSEGEFYYYNSIVPTGETLPIIESVSAEIPPNLKDRYEGKKLIVDVKSEAVLAAKNPNGTGAIYEKTWTNVQGENIKEVLNNLSNR